MPVTRADMLEGLLIAAVVFVVILVLVLALVFLSVRFQQMDSNRKASPTQATAGIAGGPAPVQLLSRGNM